MIRKGDDFTFVTTGRKIDANRGIIGLAPDGSVFGGYDDIVFYYDDPITPEERRELAEYMIAQWAAFAKADRIRAVMGAEIISETPLHNRK